VSLVFAALSGCATHATPVVTVADAPLGSGTAASARPTVVFVVRHAEKAGPSGDVTLSSAGQARARALADALADAHVDGVITTNLQRTRETGAPVARVRAIAPIEVSPGANVTVHASEIASIIRTRFAGSGVLVVGHSNTVGPIVRALGGPVIADLCDSEYSRLFVLVLSPGDSTRLIRSSYGTADAAVPTGCPAMR
jgi:phosphohistidine phosphatase SixA